MLNQPTKACQSKLAGLARYTGIRSWRSGILVASGVARLTYYYMACLWIKARASDRYLTHHFGSSLTVHTALRWWVCCCAILSVIGTGDEGMPISRYALTIPSWLHARSGDADRCESAQSPRCVGRCEPLRRGHSKPTHETAYMTLLTLSL